MPEVQIKLSALWVALMLTYLLGDVLRFWSGDATPGAFGGLKPDMVPVAWRIQPVIATTRRAPPMVTASRASVEASR
jgi:hypothetical protein